MSFYSKFSLGLVFLLLAGTQLQAQWGPMPRNSSMDPFSANGRCREVSVQVTDSAGVAIMGANVKTENSVMELTTNAQGIVSIPCHSMDSIMPTLSVTASGYQPAQITLTPDAGMGYETVRLDRTDPVLRGTGGTSVNIHELSGNVQKQSAELQTQAEQALAAKDYDSAEKLLLQALDLTPSSASIANNLGVVSLHHKDLDSAGKWFQQASDEAPLRFDILGNLGLVRWMQHRNEESYTILVKAFTHGYQSNLGNYILGTVGLEKGDSKQAAEHLKKVPGDRFPYRDLYLSIALRTIGKTKAADETYLSFLKRNPAPFLVASIR